MTLYSIAQDFSRTRVWLAVFLTLLETLRPAIVVATLLLALVLLGTLYWGQASWMPSVVVGVTCNLLCWIALFAMNYFINLREVRRALRILPTTLVNYQLSEDGCAISSDAWSEFLPWRSFLRLTRYPRMVLLEIIEHRGAIRRRGRGFPVFWMLPVPRRTFLVIPASGVPEEQIAFIRDRLVHGSSGLGTTGRV